MNTAVDDGWRGCDGLGPAALERLHAWLLDEIGIGLIVCDGCGSVRYANRCAEEELAAGRALQRVGTALRCAGTSTPTLAAAIAEAQRDGQYQLVEVIAGAHRLMLAVAPLPHAAPADALVLVVLRRHALCSTLGLELLSIGHGLTPTERSVLADLLDDSTPREIAAAHGVAVSTVRTHVASIRAKLGVHSVEALLHRVAEVPPVPGSLHASADGSRIPGSHRPRGSH